MNKQTRTLIAGAIAAMALAIPASAMATEYPPAGDPGQLQTPKGVTKTLTVCKTASKIRNKTCFGTIGAAVKAANQVTKSGAVFHDFEYIINVKPGTYKESVQIAGHGFDGLTLQGDSSDASKVKIDLSGLSLTNAQNGVKVNAASGVTVKNMTAVNYVSNGFFFVNIDKLFGGETFTADNLVAAFSKGTNGYGIYEFNSIGGTIKNSETYYNSDAGIYVGQTPVQVSPARTMITGVRSWGNELGYSGTNSKYVTITKSEWFNNGLGIVPNMLLSEQFYPPEENIITDNDVYGNNYNFYKNPKVGSTKLPFPVAHGALASADYPPGIGILLFGSQNTLVQNNRVFNNHLVGIGLLNPSILLNLTTPTQVEAAKIKGNQVIGNQLGNGGANKNGADLFYPGGNDVGTCIGGSGANANAGVLETIPAVPTWNSCPAPGGPSTESSEAIGKVTDFALDATHMKYWKNTTGQAPITVNGRKFKPLELCKVSKPTKYKGCDGQKGGKP